jgi:hypothetical protein
VVIKVSPTTLDWRGFLPSKTGFGGGQYRLVCEPLPWPGLLPDDPVALTGVYSYFNTHPPCSGLAYRVYLFTMEFLMIGSCTGRKSTMGYPSPRTEADFEDDEPLRKRDC